MESRKKLRERWVEAGYSPKMGSSKVVPPPSANYVRVYHLLPAHFAVSNIGLRRLKVARFHDLNDPFELLGVGLKTQADRKILGAFKRTRGEDMGLLCFSANWINPVLWSHYGDRHRGICLGFNLSRSDAQFVNYDDRRIRTKLRDSEDPTTISQPLQDLLLRTKFSHWSYEEEVRTFVALSASIKEGDLHYCSYDSNLQLAEVILGPQCAITLELVRRLVDSLYSDVVTFKARLAFGEFSVVPLQQSLPASRRKSY